MNQRDRSWVAELLLPTAVFGPTDLRERLVRPEHYGAVRGYWRIHYALDHLGTHRPDGIGLTIEFVASTLQDAEDVALDLADRIQDVFAFSTGSPAEPPQLLRLAAVGPRGGVLEQHVYFVSDGAFRSPRVQMRRSDISMLLERMPVLPPGDQYRIQLAMRWYTASVSARTSLDSLLATWIGLESVGPSIDALFHPGGSKTECPVCRNAPGKKRDRKRAGIEHILLLVAPELTNGRTINDIATLRDQIAHGLIPAALLEEQARELAGDLQLVLGIAILTAVRRRSETQGYWEAALPRDYSFRPDARASLISTTEIGGHRPYFGEWIPVERTHTNEQSRCDEEGRYFHGAGVRIGWQPTLQRGVPFPSREYVEFNRRGVVTNHVGSVESGSPPPIPRAEWRQEALSAAWLRNRREGS